MEEHMNKKRRIYSLEPRKTMQASFARKYVNYLVPALTKISSTKEMSSSSSDRCFDDNERQKNVRHEVDMALALSAEGFAWSQALKDKLQLNIVNNNISSSTTDAANQANVTENAMLLKKPERAKGIIEMETGAVEEEGIESEEQMMRYVRNVFPGGKEMMVDDDTLLCELGSYISCLELQVNILRSMVETN